jgi:hypothetical protein
MCIPLLPIFRCEALNPESDHCHVQMILHSLTHIESVAVDLAWDAIARFGNCDMGYQLPKEFFDDFVAVAEDEARHFRILAERLKVLNLQKPLGDTFVGACWCSLNTFQRKSIVNTYSSTRPGMCVCHIVVRVTGAGQSLWCFPDA